jgi:molecular chaperone GrpE
MNEPAQTDTSPPANGASPENETALREELQTLRERLQAAEAERDKFRTLAQQARADFENYQKRLKRDFEQERRYAELPLARDLIPAIDNLDRATAAAQKANETGPLVQGVAMVKGQVLDVLRRHGITPMDALGKPFDPNLHQAVMQQPSAEHPPGTVVEITEQGFQMHDRVVRPAQVIVSVAAENNKKPT